MKPSAVQVREFAESDRATVIALWERVFRDDPPHNAPAAMIRRKLATQRELFLVATCESRVVGTVLGGYDGVRGWVYHLAVEAGLRRQGIGRALMREVEQLLAARGCPKLNLQVRAGNQGVVRFYESLGYAVEVRVSLGRLLAKSAPDPNAAKS